MFDAASDEEQENGEKVRSVDDDVEFAKKTYNEKSDVSHSILIRLMDDDVEFVNVWMNENVGTAISCNQHEQEIS